MPFCARTTTQQMTDQAGCDAAKAIMSQTLATYFPVVPEKLYPAYSDCVVDTAKAPEDQRFCKDAIVGSGPNTGNMVHSVLARPEAQVCLEGKVGSSFDETLAAGAG
jgi:hypothetical protein